MISKKIEKERELHNNIRLREMKIQITIEKRLMKHTSKKCERLNVIHKKDYYTQVRNIVFVEYNYIYIYNYKLYFRSFVKICTIN